MKKLITVYGAHLLLAVVGLANVVAGLNPKMLPPQYAFLVTLAGLIMGGVHHGFTMGWAAPVLRAALDAAAKAGTTAAAVVLAIILAPMLHGCATVQADAAKVNAAVTSPEAQPLITAAALVAVGTAEQNGVTAAQIVSIGNAALAADSGSTATLAAVGAAVNVQLAKLNLPAQDVAALQILEGTVGAAIQAQINASGSNATVAQSQAAIADVLSAIVTAAGGTPITAPAAVSSAPAPVTDVPVQNHTFTLASVESPATIGAATSALVVSLLKSCAHVNISAPAAAFGVVGWTLLAGYLQL